MLIAQGKKVKNTEKKMEDVILITVGNTLLLKRIANQKSSQKKEQKPH